MFGGAIVIWGLHGIGTNLTISPSTKEDHQLVTTGAFGLVRHPLYTGVFVESVGVCVLMANWFALLCASTFCGLIATRTQFGEENLVATFGDEYEQYIQNVGKFLPRFTMSDRWQSLLRTQARNFAESNTASGVFDCAASGANGDSRAQGVLSCRGEIEPTNW